MGCEEPGPRGVNLGQTGQTQDSRDYIATPPEGPCLQTQVAWSTFANKKRMAANSMLMHLNMSHARHCGEIRQKLFCSRRV